MFTTGTLHAFPGVDHVKLLIAAPWALKAPVALDSEVVETIPFRRERDQECGNIHKEVVTERVENWL